VQASNTPMLVSKKAQEGLVEYHKQCYQLLGQQWNIREQMRNVDLAYIRELDWTKANQRAKVANAYGDADRIQNITPPVVMPAVEDAVAYQGSVFLQGNPIFGVVASPQYQDEAMQMETVIDENANRTGWVRQLDLFFRDGFKYNISFIETVWDRIVTAALETDIAFGNGKVGKPKEVIWEGNCLRRWDPYNTFFDTRIAPAEIPSKGEFIGKTELMGRVALKQFINELPDKMIDNINAAFDSGMGASVGGSNLGGIESFYLPEINPNALINKSTMGTTDWAAWAGITGALDGSKILYKNLYEVTTLYARIIPSDFTLSVPSRNTPQVWKLIFINHQVLIYAERQTNVHGWLPVLVGQPLEDGLWYQTKSHAQNAKPFQDVSNTLMNSVIAARRRAISDRGIYDPSRITEAAINSPNPSAKIPVRPSAYGKNVAESYHQIPFEDRNSSEILQLLPAIAAMSNRALGSNQAKQGQFVKGNKTLHEYADVMQHSNARDQMVSLKLEHQVFVPMKNIIKMNILQYQGGVSYYNRTAKKDVAIDPVALRKAVVEFKVSDGLVPSDKLINADTLQVALQVLGSSPQMAAGYDTTGLFSYLMKTQGADLSPFEKSPQQQAYEQALNQWSQQYQMLMSEVKILIKAATPEDMMKLLKEVNSLIPPMPDPKQFGIQPNGAPASETPEGQPA
jgi:hypothetical protein